MTYKVSIPPRVRGHLKLASAWYAERSGSVAVAERWHNGFLATLDSLKTNPSRCGVAHESECFDFEIRELLYGSGRRKTHRALFRIVGDRVEILAIRHVAQRDLNPDDL